MSQESDDRPCLRYCSLRWSRTSAWLLVVVISATHACSITFAQRGGEASGEAGDGGHATSPFVQSFPLPAAESIRGLSCPTDDVVWCCGSHRSIYRTTDGGLSWDNVTPQQFSADAFVDLEFRSIVAFDAQNAVVATAGTPAKILKTMDGGGTWSTVYSNDSANAFFDGMQFLDAENGIAFSDPVDGKLLVVTTQDGGRRWVVVPKIELPTPRASEAGFAASNSSICITEERVCIGTGGTDADTSRIYLAVRERTLGNRNWQTVPCPLPSSPTEGVFSIAYSAEQKLFLAAGGDYRPGERSRATMAISRDQGQTWRLAKSMPELFQSAVVAVQELEPSESTTIFVSTGQAASYGSLDGETWLPLPLAGFHALAVSPRFVYFAGSEGRVSRVAKPALSEMFENQP